MKTVVRIEDKIEAKAIPQSGNLVKPIPSLEKPLVKLSVTWQTSLKSKDKIALEIVNQKLEELVKKRNQLPLRLVKKGTNYLFN